MFICFYWLLNIRFIRCAQFRFCILVVVAVLLSLNTFSSAFEQVRWNHQSLVSMWNGRLWECLSDFTQIAIYSPPGSWVYRVDCNWWLDITESVIESREFFCPALNSVGVNLRWCSIVSCQINVSWLKKVASHCA